MYSTPENLQVASDGYILLQFSSYLEWKLQSSIFIEKNASKWEL